MSASNFGETAPALRRWVRRRLLAWFEQHRRDLPWRHTRDPYAIWVSEVMLQQTQVAAVIPYFQRFLAALPTIAALAAVEEQQVLRLWEGLGYYRRACNLHQAARWLVEHHQGIFPDDPAALRDLPGVGRYTLGAILSQAFERRLPILEANSQRVLCRFLGYRADPRRGPVQKKLWRAAEELLPSRQVGSFNQALMELGALICAAKGPQCAQCPLRDRCQARLQGLQDQIPYRPAPVTPTEVREAAVVVRRGAEVLLLQRPASGRWAGLWEFPHGPLEEGEEHETAARRLVRELAGLEIDLGPELLTLRHGVTRFRITLVCFEASHRAGRYRSAFYQTERWLAPADLHQFPVSSPQRRLARVLLQEPQRRLF